MTADRENFLPVWMRNPQAQYGLATLAVGTAAFARYFLIVAPGFTHSLVFFYPTILGVALLAGFYPGLFATMLSAAVADYCFVIPLYSFKIEDFRDGFTILIFLIVGLSICWAATLVRRKAARLQEFELAIEGLEEMIVVIDRDYRYLIANRAFLDYRGVKIEALIGRRVEDMLTPGVFQNTLKTKIDECFTGKKIEFGMHYEYLTRGHRELFITYFPVRGQHGIDRVACVLQDITDRKESERSLRLFRALVDQSNDAVEVIDAVSLRFLDVNEKSCKDLGYTREELLALTVFEITPGADQSSCNAVIDEIRRERAVLKKSTHRRKNGSEFPVEVTFKYVELDRGYVIAVSRDISEQVKAEAALRESEDQYRDLVENTEELLCTHDLEGKLLSVNPGVARVLGYEVEDLLNRPLRQFMAPDSQAQFPAYLNRMRTNRSDAGLLSVVTRNGQRREWQYRNTLRTDGMVEPIVRSIAHDVTARRQAELALSNSEQRYRQLFEKNLAGVVIVTLEGQIVDCNDAWARMLGYSGAEEVRARPATDFYFNPEDRQRLVDELRRDRAFESAEVQLRRKDGTPAWVLFNSVLLPAGNGVELVQGTVIDISTRKRAEQDLCRREEDYRRFVANSSEGIFREELDAPLLIDLPEEELIHHILYDSYMAECNDAMARMYGFSSGQAMAGKRLREMLSPDDPRNIDLTRDYIRSGFRVLERESHEVDVHGNPKVFRNSMIGIVEDGKLLRTWGIQRDVTEQVKLEAARAEAETALRKSEEHFRILVEQASDGIFVTDAQGRCLDVNTAGAEMLGYSRDEILHLSIPDLLADADSQRLATEIGRFAGGAVIRSEWTFHRKDGSCFPGEVCGKQLPDGRLQGILRDMTERKKAEEEMRRSEERFRVALKDSPITVFSQDRDLRYTWLYNARLYWANDALTKTDEEILGPRKAASLTRIKRRVLTTGVAAREEIVVPADGRRFAFDLTIEPLFDNAGNVVGITGAGMDIAKLRELADRLQDSRDRLEVEKIFLEEEIQKELGFEAIIGNSPALMEVLRKTSVVAPTDSTVLLLGETGTGKELVARSVHARSSRHDKTFVKLNCAAVPSGLLESELFGHEKGAFTGAVSQKVGRIELANKGTLFLDEIGELPLELQPKLLRVLQDREFERLGSVQTLGVDVRIIAATNRDLPRDIADRRFREDLYYRLNVFPIECPPLRERKDDIPILVGHFVEKYAARMRKHVDVIPDETMRILQNWSWPGNVRELENMVERMMILSKGRVLAGPPAELHASDDAAPDDLTEMEREHVIRVLRETRGVVSGADGAAARLGLKRTTLQSMLKRFGIAAEEFRRGNGSLDPNYT